MTAETGEGTSDRIQIGYYEDWMFDQVVELFVAEYGFDLSKQREVFRRFYEAPFQRSHGIRLVAVEGSTVCGFQSYFYWPYRHQGTLLKTFQSGSSLVSPNYRGRQIFARLLNFLGEADSAKRPEIDFLMGFPVEMSFGSFLRNKWANPLDLVWYAKPIHPLSVVLARRPDPTDWSFETAREQFDPYYGEDQFSLSKDLDFSDWRRDAREIVFQYLYFHHHDANGTVRFELKPNRRGRINELVIGDVVRSSPDPNLLRAGLRALLGIARRHSFLAMLSIALNEESANQSLVGAIRECGFFRLKKRIHFIVKPIKDYPGCTDASRWNLLRSDIDTW